MINVLFLSESTVYDVAYRGRTQRLITRREYFLFDALNVHESANHAFPLLYARPASEQLRGISLVTH